MAVALHVGPLTFYRSRYRRHGLLASLYVMPFLAAIWVFQVIWYMFVLAWEITKWTALSVVWCIAVVRVWLQ